MRVSVFLLVVAVLAGCGRGYVPLQKGNTGIQIQSPARADAGSQKAIP